ncbi:hypothetical protein CIPAW_03G199600 [Carya illinoinensis]|uniref:Uncharacterized protein n=1 Tax=Carya illinoinensis TaxID=32201 RepID=A0A8T1R5N8_CARIL|nr:hypothetical protein CIPAW_03G199600 [Carya illinoinensis]
MGKFWALITHYTTLPFTSWAGVDANVLLPL